MTFFLSLSLFLSLRSERIVCTSGVHTFVCLLSFVVCLFVCLSIVSFSSLLCFPLSSVHGHCHKGSVTVVGLLVWQICCGGRLGGGRER